MGGSDAKRVTPHVPNPPLGGEMFLVFLCLKRGTGTHPRSISERTFFSDSGAEGTEASPSE
jgi:hypothetical protein